MPLDLLKYILEELDAEASGDPKDTIVLCSNEHQQVKISRENAMLCNRLKSILVKYQLDDCSVLDPIYVPHATTRILKLACAYSAKHKDDHLYHYGWKGNATANDALESEIYACPEGQYEPVARCIMQLGDPHLNWDFTFALGLSAADQADLTLVAYYLDNTKLVDFLHAVYGMSELPRFREDLMPELRQKETWVGVMDVYIPYAEVSQSALKDYNLVERAMSVKDVFKYLKDEPN